MSYKSFFLASTPSIQRSGPYFFDETPQSPWTPARCDTIIATLAGRLEHLKTNGTTFLCCSTDEDTKDEPTPQSPNILKLKHTNLTTYTKKRRRARDDSGGQTPPKRKSGAGPLTSPKRAQGETRGATPFLVRAKEAGGDNQSMAVQAQQLAERESPQLIDKLRPPAFSSGPSQYQLKQQLKQAKATMPADRYAMSMHVCESYRALLRATEGASGRDSYPSKSLLSMCLRAMPARLKLEQEMDDIETKAADMKLIMATRNFSNKMYSDIHDLDLGGHGGEHVRTILRAHGTAIMRDAIDCGLLSHEFGTLSLMHCIQMRCKLEAEALVTTVLSKVYWGEPTSFLSRLPASLSVLEDFRSYTGSVSAYFRVLKNILSQKRLPIQWLATKAFQSLWPRLYTALAGNTHYRDAEELSLAVLPLLFEACSDAAHNVSAVTTFTSLLSTLCTIVLVERTRSSSEQASSGINDVLEAFIIDISNMKRSYHTCIQPLLSILTDPASSEKADFSRYVPATTSDDRAADSFHHIWSLIPRLICSFLSGCERAESGLGLHQLQKLSKVIKRGVLNELPDYQCLEGAMARGLSAFVSSLPDMSATADARDAAQTLLRHLGLDPEPSVCLGDSGVGDIAASPLPESSVMDPAGCRWEEGIGEWVAITPDSDMMLGAGVYGFGSQIVESPLAPYREKVRARSSYTSKHKRSTVKNNSRPLLDLLPLSPTSTAGVNMEAESSFLSEITTCSNQARLLGDDCELRAPPKKFRKPANGHRVTSTSQNERRVGYGIYELSHAGSADLFTHVDMRDGVSLRTPFSPSKSRITKAAAINSHYNMDSSGDELGQ